MLNSEKVVLKPKQNRIGHARHKIKILVALARFSIHTENTNGRTARGDKGDKQVYGLDSL